MRVAALQDLLLRWYQTARRDLPWRKTRDPYAIWVSEVMLQQTRVETVVPYYARFLERFPDVHALAEAPLDQVLSLWSGLGYYRRARMLHEGARRVSEAGGVFPESAEGLRAIRGIGRYTAGAIASIAFGRRAALVDGNVARVLARLFAVEDDVRTSRGLGRIWAIAEELVPEGDPGAFNQALMELGATICVPRAPRCLLCPVLIECGARAAGTERLLPVLAAKAKPVTVQGVALVASRSGSVLVGRRRADSLFGGMWEPPRLEGVEGDAKARFEALVGARLGPLVPRGRVVHVLSHRRLELDVVSSALRAALGKFPESGDYDAFELVPVADLHDRGLSTLARKLLVAANVK